MLNTSEIQMHSELVKVFDDEDGININNCTLNHSVVYSQQYGSIIIINFNHAGKIVRSVPLSILSVMEANAYASEILLKIKIIENNKDENSSVSLKILEREFLEFINEADLSEYNLLLCLCEIHYNYLSLKYRMIFLQSIIRFVLNLGAMKLSIISSFLKHTFINKRVGNAICMDLQRGASRHIVVFKLLLLIYQFINESDEDEKLNLLSEIETHPYQLIRKALVYYNIQIDDLFERGDLSEFHLTLKWIASSQEMFDKEILLYSSDFNRTLLKNKTFFDLELSNFRLLD